MFVFDLTLFIADCEGAGDYGGVCVCVCLCGEEQILKKKEYLKLKIMKK